MKKSFKHQKPRGVNEKAEKVPPSHHRDRSQSKDISILTRPNFSKEGDEIPLFY
jgi:hypothetical protein